MKEIKIRIDSVEKKEYKKIPMVKFESDYFKCRRCGYTVRMRVLGNTATCSQCGGTMDRC